MGVMVSLHTVLLGLFVAYFVAACGSNSTSQLTSEQTSFFDLLDYWEAQAPLCKGYPSKKNCDDGDMALFNALLCASGVMMGCEGVKNSQGDDGQFWRSPRRTPGNLGEKKSFSRDMATGVLVYLVVQKDREAATRWMDWILENRACAIYKPQTLGGGCWVYAKHYRLCRDDEYQSCLITPVLWALMAEVWHYLGLELVGPMQLFHDRLDYWTIAETHMTSPGYSLHLKAVDIYLRQLMGIKESMQDRVLNIILDKQPQNPFFQFLAAQDPRLIQKKVLDVCPQIGSENLSRQMQWSWERDTSEQAWRDSMLWDCVFMLKLIL